MTQMTLNDLINIRGRKYDDQLNVSKTEFQKGYEQGWRWAYRDIKEIFQQNGFDLEQLVIKN